MRSLYSFMYPIFAMVITNNEVDPHDFIQFRAVEEAADIIRLSEATVYPSSKVRMAAVSTVFPTSDSDSCFPDRQYIRPNDMSRDSADQFLSDLKQLEKDVTDPMAKDAISAVRAYLENDEERLSKSALPLAAAVAYAGSKLASSIVVPLFNASEPERSAALVLSPLVPDIILNKTKAHAVAYPICNHIDSFDKKIAELSGATFLGLISVASADTVRALESILNQMETTVGNPKHPACGSLTAPARIKSGGYAVAFSPAPIYLTDDQVKRLAEYVKIED